MPALLYWTLRVRACSLETRYSGKWLSPVNFTTWSTHKWTLMLLLKSFLGQLWHWTSVWDLFSLWLSRRCSLLFNSVWAEDALVQKIHVTYQPCYWLNSQMGICDFEPDSQSCTVHLNSMCATASLTLLQLASEAFCQFFVSAAIFHIGFEQILLQWHFSPCLLTMFTKLLVYLAREF